MNVSLEYKANIHDNNYQNSFNSEETHRTNTMRVESDDDNDDDNSY